jgi:hypothetical protein
MLGLFHIFALMSEVVVPTNISWELHVFIFTLFPLNFLIIFFVIYPTILLEFAFIFMSGILRALLRGPKSL